MSASPHTIKACVSSGGGEVLDLKSWKSLTNDIISV